MYNDVPLRPGGAKFHYGAVCSSSALIISQTVIPAEAGICFVTINNILIEKIALLNKKIKPFLRVSVAMLFKISLHQYRPSFRGKQTLFHSIRREALEDEWRLWNSTENAGLKCVKSLPSRVNPDDAYMKKSFFLNPRPSACIRG